MGPSSPSQCRITFILVHSSHLALSEASRRTSAVGQEWMRWNLYAVRSDGKSKQKKIVTHHRHMVDLNRYSSSDARVWPNHYSRGATPCSTLWNLRLVMLKTSGDGVVTYLRVRLARMG
jgi:Ni/Co efflux regulator RcnB